MKNKIYLIIALLFAIIPLISAGTTYVDICQDLNISGETYILSDGIMVSGSCFTISNDSITLDGDGKGVLGNNLPGSIGVYATNVSNITIKNIELIGFSGAGIPFPPPSGAAIIFDNVNRYRIINSKFSTNTFSNIRDSNGVSSNYGYIANNLISGGQGGILLMGNNTIIYNNTITSGSGIMWGDPSLKESNITFENNKINSSIVSIYYTQNFVGANLYPINFKYSNHFGSIKWTSSDFLTSASVIGDISFPGNIRIGTYNSCYQETANVATSCGGLATGNYAASGSWTNSINVYDGDWTTFGIGGAFAIPDPTVYINYSKPTNVQQEGTVWQVKDAGGTVNITIPDACWNAHSDKILLKVISTNAPPFTKTVYWYCNDGLNPWINIRSNSVDARVYEEAMIWAIPIGNFVSLNSDAFAGQAINSSADIILDLTGFYLDNPKVLKGGIECSAPECNIISYTNSIITFNVTSWSSYTITGDYNPPIPPSQNYCDATIQGINGWIIIIGLIGTVFFLGFIISGIHGAFNGEVINEVTIISGILTIVALAILLISTLVIVPTLC